MVFRSAEMVLKKESEMCFSFSCYNYVHSYLVYYDERDEKKNLPFL